MSSWYWLSFADDGGFKGGCYVDGDALDGEPPIQPLESSDQDFGRAYWRANQLGINPGGEVRGAGPIPVEKLPPEWDRNRLLQKHEIADAVRWSDGQVVK